MGVLPGNKNLFDVLLFNQLINQMWAGTAPSSKTYMAAEDNFMNGWAVGEFDMAKPASPEAVNAACFLTESLPQQKA